MVNPNAQQSLSELLNLLPQVITIAKEAGGKLLSIYQSQDYESFIKDDDTPVTSADYAAHQHVIDSLTKLTPSIPVLSEESDEVSLEVRSQWATYWLIDPLDGTQEFIKKTGEFSTVIALVQNNQPVMGVVYAPVSNTLYFASQDGGAWMKAPDKVEAQRLKTKKRNRVASSDQAEKPLIITISHSQNLERFKSKISTQHQYQFKRLGSASLKSCLVASGGADAYVRFGPTGEWDTAAVQCILQEAGGAIKTTQLQPMTYNERESLINPNFIALGDASHPWNNILLV